MHHAHTLCIIFQGLNGPFANGRGFPCTESNVSKEFGVHIVTPERTGTRGCARSKRSHAYLCCKPEVDNKSSSGNVPSVPHGHTPVSHRVARVCPQAEYQAVRWLKNSHLQLHKQAPHCTAAQPFFKKSPHGTGCLEEAEDLVLATEKSVSGYCLPFLSFLSHSSLLPACGESANSPARGVCVCARLSALQSQKGECFFLRGESNMDDGGIPPEGKL